MTADVVLLAGRVRTMDARRPLAQGIAWRAGRLVAVGTRDEVLAWSGPRTRVVEAPAACALPGFHDAHLHLTQHGLELEQVGLADAATLAEGLERVAAAAAGLPHGDWILGAGFALQRWGLRGLDRRDLDRAAPRHPVLLRSQDHHSAWANSAALARAGIVAGTEDPEGGVIVRGADGEPSGLLLEAAVELVRDAVPLPDAETLGRALDAAGRDLAERGITTVHHMAAEPAGYWRAIATRAGRADGRPYPLRVWAAIPHADLEHAMAIGLAGGHGGDHFVVGGAKFFADGALGSRTAWMLQPYGEGGVGMVEDGPELLRERYELAARAGFAPVTHAIGDAANRAVLDALEATEPAWRAAGLRPRIEHVQHLHEADVPRVARLGVVASMQPIHLTFDAASLRSLLPDRLDRAYRTRDLQGAGVPLAFGSDTPVASPDVVAGLRAAVGRRAADDGLVLGAEQALTTAEALQAYTTGAAFAIGREGRSGMLREGYDADVVLLDHDPHVGLDDLAVVATVMDGEFTHGGDALGG